jgi:phage-related protein
MGRRLIWVGSSQKDFLVFPLAVKDDIMSALRFAQKSGKEDRVKPLQGFSGASVLKVIPAGPIAVCILSNSK